MRAYLAKQLDHDPLFRWRGEAVTRIENLSDIVFALALGMLVSASSPPVTFDELQRHLLNIVPVTAGFAVLLSIWHGHFTFFRRYGVADGKIIFLNAVMLLLILFIAYPLRFCFDSLFLWVLSASTGDYNEMMARGFDFDQARLIITYFAIGFAVIQLLLGLMYQHARSRAELLELSPSELAITRRSMWIAYGEIVVALMVAGAAYFTMIGPFAGGLMFLLWPVAIIVGRAIPIPETQDEDSAS